MQGIQLHGCYSLVRSAAALVRVDEIVDASTVAINATTETRKLAWVLLGLAWPVVLEQALFTFVILADVYLVSHIGSTALAAVGLAGQMLLVPTATISAVGIGATALVARQTGAGHWEGASRLAAQAMLLASVLGGLSALGLAVWAEPILRLTGAAPDVVAEGTLWLRIAAPGFALRSVMSAGNATLRGAGDMRTPVLIHSTVSLLNIGLAWVLTQGAWGLPRLGIAGSALGVAVEQALGGLAVLAWYAQPGARLRLAWAWLRPDLAQLKRILAVGLPAGVEQIVFQACLAAQLGLIAQIGTEAIAAHQITLRISFLASLPGWGFSVALTTLVGQALGQRQHDRARQYTRLAGWLGLGTMGLIGLGLWVWEQPILRIFTADAQVLAQGGIALRLAVLMLPLMAASFAYSGALYGSGDTGAILGITLAASVLVRLGLAFAAVTWLGLGLAGVWLSIGADYACRAVLAGARLQAGLWRRTAGRPT